MESIKSCNLIHQVHVLSVGVWGVWKHWIFVIFTRHIYFMPFPFKLITNWPELATSQILVLQTPPRLIKVMAPNVGVWGVWKHWIFVIFTRHIYFMPFPFKLSSPHCQIHHNSEQEDMSCRIISFCGEGIQGRGILHVVLHKSSINLSNSNISM